MTGLVPTAAERAALDAVIDEARASAAGPGPAFAAAVLQGDEVLAVRSNETHIDHDPSRHAEIVAIAAAARRLERSDLSGCTLIASMQPCEMCLAAMRWAGIDRLVFAMPQEDADPALFRFPQLRIEDFRRADLGDFDYAGGLGAGRVADLYRRRG